MKINWLLGRPMFQEEMEKKLQVNYDDEDEVYIFLAEYCFGDGNRSDLEGLDIALQNKKGDTPFVLCSNKYPLSHFLNDRRFIELISRGKVAFMTYPFSSLQFINVYNKLVSNIEQPSCLN